MHRNWLTRYLANPPEIESSLSEMHTRAVDVCQRRSYGSLDDILADYSLLTRDDRIVALNLFCQSRHERADGLLIELLESADAMEAGVASAALSMIAGDQCMSRLASIAASADDEDIVCRVLSVMANISASAMWDTIAATARNVLGNKSYTGNTHRLAVDALVNIARRSAHLPEMNCHIRSLLLSLKQGEELTQAASDGLAFLDQVEG